MTRVWFITGASRGFGLALTEAVLESGDSVAATARNADKLKPLITQYGADRIVALSLDVTNNEEVVETVTRAHEKFGRIDVVVNNAGYAGTSSIEDVPLDVFRAQIDTNFLGVVYVTKAVLPILRRQGSGHIMQVSSVGGRVGSPGLGAYQSAKWAVGGFSTVLAQEVGPLGIKITVLEPGGMKTDFAGSSMVDGPISEPYQKTVGAFKEMIEQSSDNWTDPRKIADAVLHISKVDEPPLRLLLGADTVQYAQFVSKQLAESDAKWESVTKLSY